MHSCEIPQYHQHKRNGGIGYNLFKPYLADDNDWTPPINIGDDCADDIKVKILKVIYWNVDESNPKQCVLEGLVFQEGDSSQAPRHNNVQDLLMHKLDDVTTSLKAWNELWCERNRYNKLREMEIKTYLWMMDTKLALLNVKQENMEMIVDSFIGDPNDCMK